MLALRSTMMRCCPALNKISKNTFESVKLLQVKNVHILTKAAPVPMSRDISVVQPQMQSVLLHSLLTQRPFATKPEQDVDVKNLERIYYGTLTPRMRAVKVFSLTTSIAGLVAQPILMEQGVKMSGTGLGVFLCCFGGFFTFVTPLLLHFITKKYVTEMHYNPATGEYIATTINIILQKIQTKFQPSDVKIPEVPGMFTSFIVGKKSLFVEPAIFDDPEHYVRIMGYDKPIDFKLGPKEANNTATDELNKSEK